MRPDLDLHDLPPHRRGHAVAVLGAGPWFWPLEEDVAGMAVAERLMNEVGGARRSTPPAGATVVASSTSEGERASVWIIGVDGDASARNRSKPLAGTALVAWRDAGEAVSRNVPLLWGSLSDAVRARPDTAVRANSVTLRAGCLPPSETHLDGASYGLSMSLMIIARALGLPIPADLVASATIDPHGKLGVVGKVREKVLAVALTMPRVRRFLIAPDSEDEARRAIAEVNGCQMAAIPVPHLTSAIQEVWGDELRRHLADAGVDHARRAELVDAFFRIALKEGRAALRDFAPLRDAIHCARSEWRDLTAVEREKLDFSHAVASRHCDNSGELAVPTEAALASMPHEVRLKWISHVVQQAADSSSPPATDARELAERHLVRGLDASADHLRLLGALARLLAVTGQPQRALEYQEEAANALLARYLLDDLSYQLAEWYRLAGAIGGEVGISAFERAEEFDARLRARGGPSTERTGWTRVPRLVARVALGLANDDDAAALVHLAHEAEADSLQASAARCLAVLSRSDLYAACAKYPSVDETTRNADWRRAARLMALDEALAQGRAGDAAKIVEEMRTVEPGLIQHLLQAGHGAPAHVARFYPY